MPTRKKLDVNQLAKSIVDQATGDVPKVRPSLEGRKASGRAGGLKGGKTRMDALTPEQRSELAKQAAAARWQKEAPTTKAGAVKVTKGSAKQN